MANKGLKRLNRILRERDRIARTLTDLTKRTGINTGYKMVKARIREAAMESAKTSFVLRK
jgi:hypothetical protein